MNEKSISVTLTPAMSKRLLAKAVAGMDCVKEKLKKGIVFIGAGTTNCYVIEEILTALGCAFDSGKKWVKGFTAGNEPAFDRAETAEVVIVDGQWRRDTLLADVLNDIREGDIVVKGGNAVYTPTGDVGVLIGNPMGGTVIEINEAVLGKRARLIAPVGLEKRVDRPIGDLMAIVNAPGAVGCRLGFLPGKAYTEIEAIADLTGARAVLIAGGGVLGAEGACIFQISGDDAALERVRALVSSLKDEKPFGKQ